MFNRFLVILFFYVVCHVGQAPFLLLASKLPEKPAEIKQGGVILTKGEQQLLKENGSVPFVYLPKPTGPFSVGTKAIHVEDPSRLMFRGTEKRHWMVQAYFPRKTPRYQSPFRVHGGYPYAPGTFQAGKLGNTYVETYASPYNDVKRDGDTVFPVVILAPSLSFCRQNYTILCEELASLGFVVLVLDFPYVTSLVRFNDGTSIVPTFADLWKLRKDQTYQQTLESQAYPSIIGDITWMLSSLSQLSRYLGCHFDMTRVLLMGHGIGAKAVHAVGLDDYRVAGLVEFSPSLLAAHSKGETCEEDKEDAKKEGPALNAKPVLLVVPKTGASKEVKATQTIDKGADPKTAKNAQNVKNSNGAATSLIAISKTDPLNNGGLINQEVWHIPGEQDAITDFSYLSFFLPDLKSSSATYNFLTVVFRINPVYDTQNTTLYYKDPTDWVSDYKRHLSKWLVDNHFLS